jgi:hypothetical protein
VLKRQRGAVESRESVIAAVQRDVKRIPVRRKRRRAVGPEPKTGGACDA